MSEQINMFDMIKELMEFMEKEKEKYPNLIRYFKQTFDKLLKK